jgi:hypothetical protein
MSIFALPRGLPQTESQNFASTSPVNMLTAIGSGKESGLDVTQIIVANPNAAARTITISRWDGTTAWPLFPGKSIPAVDYVILECYIRLARSESIRVTPGAADTITVHVNYIVPAT